MSHTKGLLATNHDRIESKDEHGWINDGWIIAQCQGPDAIDNARRLVACWNACEGLPQDALDGGWTTADMSQYAKRLEEERDELLAALLSAYNFLQGIPQSLDKNDLCIRIVALLAKYKEAE